MKSTFVFFLTDYYDYVSGCKQGLKNAFELTNFTYKFGGPAGFFRDQNHPLCWSLLKECSNSESDCPVNFISFHKKGNGSAQEVLNGSDELLDKMHRMYPTLQRIPVANE